jgi:hypothetical protein
MDRKANFGMLNLSSALGTLASPYLSDGPPVLVCEEVTTLLGVT